MGRANFTGLLTDKSSRGKGKRRGGNEMRTLNLTALFTLGVIILIPAVAGADDYVEGEVLVKCTEELIIDNSGGYPQTGDPELDDLIVELGVYDIPEIYDFLPEGEVEDPNGKWDNDDWQDMMDEQEYNTYYEFKYSSDDDPLSVAEMFEACGIVDFAEPNYLYELEEYPVIGGMDFIPNDPLFNDQWNFHNTGQTGGTADADIDAPEAWNYWPLHPMRKPHVAVVDSGADLDHPDLANNLLPGWNFIEQSATPNDTVGHGTHVAGIITAVTNNGIGVAGTGRNWIKVRPIKVTVGTKVHEKAACGGIMWATWMGADVINLSWGGYNYSKAEHEAIQGAWKLGVVVCGSKGNDYIRNGPGNKHFPSDHKEVIAVTATDHDDHLWFWYAGPRGGSNYGPDTECAGPGEYVKSTYLNGNYTLMTGTSMAAPHASAICALIQAHFPYAIYPPCARVGEVRSILQVSCDDVNHWGFPGWDEWIGWGRVNLKKTMDNIIDDMASYGPGKPSSSRALSDVEAQTEGLSAFPAVFRLYQNYPNPAAGTTSFKFDLPERVGGTRVTLEVYDLSGRRVATVLDENLGPGSYERSWDCSSESGHNLPAGVYVYRLRAGADVATRKFVVTAK